MKNDKNKQIVQIVSNIIQDMTSEELSKAIFTSLQSTSNLLFDEIFPTGDSKIWVVIHNALSRKWGFQTHYKWDFTEYEKAIATFIQCSKELMIVEIQLALYRVEIK